MFDLNKPPLLIKEEINPQDSGPTEKKLQIQATSPAPKTLASSSRNYPFDSSDLAHHARLPPHAFVFSEAPATAWRGSSRAVPKHNLAMLTSAAGDGVPAVRDVIVSPLFRHGRVVEILSRNGAGGGLSGTQNPASPCQTTMDLDCHLGSDGESDGYMPRNYWDNSNAKTVLVDLDTLPDESPVELQFPWSPVHQAEAPLHTTLLRESSENLQVSASKLTPKELEEEQRLREVAFNAAFKLETQRCTPAARCRSCLAFCQTRLPSSQVGCGTGKAMQTPEDCPPVLRNVADEDRQTRKIVRHGPKSKSSEYRGVTLYKRTGRWEAHIWHDGAQAHLGAFGTKEEAARAYDQAALVLYGTDVDINFEPESYQLEISYLYKLSKQQLVIYLRRDSRGFEAQASYPGVRHVKNFYEATYEIVFFRRTSCKAVLLGTFANEEDAASQVEGIGKVISVHYIAEPAFTVSLHGMNRRAVFKEAVRNSHGALASLILDTHHVRNMPSYAAQRFAALFPEAVEGTQGRNQAKVVSSKRPSVPNSTSTPQMKKRSTCERRQATQPNQDSTSPPTAAIAIAAPLHSGATEQLPGRKINGNIEVSPGALTPTRSLGGMGAYLEPRTRPQHAAGVNLAEAQHLNSSHTHQPSNGNYTAAHLQLLRASLPKFFRASAATTASSSCGEPRVTFVPRPTGGPRVSFVPRPTGEASSNSSAVINFKLFNVEITVAVEPGAGGDWNQAPQLRNQLTLPPSKRITRARRIGTTALQPIDLTAE